MELLLSFYMWAPEMVLRSSSLVGSWERLLRPHFLCPKRSPSQAGETSGLTRLSVFPRVNVEITYLPPFTEMIFFLLHSPLQLCRGPSTAMTPSGPLIHKGRYRNVWLTDMGVRGRQIVPYSVILRSGDWLDRSTLATVSMSEGWLLLFLKFYAEKDINIGGKEKSTL